MTQHFRFDLRPPPLACPIVLLHEPAPASAPEAAAPRQRRRLWELSPSLHCSIIGTCLSAGELRRILVKAGKAIAGASDHELHKQAVGSAGLSSGPAKLLNKALDREHRLSISQFARAASEAELRALWQAARQRGEIPGGYWALLTHPAASQALIAEAFGDVHMLSHLVGAANRADIRRLAALEAEKADLVAKVARQQEQLRLAVVSRDAKIRELTEVLARDLTRQPSAPTDRADAALAGVAAELRRDLDRERTRRRRVEERLEAAQAELARERGLRLAAEAGRAALCQELEALEAGLVPAHDAEPATAPMHAALRGLTLLYVGGRPGQLRQMRTLAESSGAVLLDHDGGVEDSASLLPGLVGRADAVLFPVDCVSHSAVSTIKQVCRLGAKPYVALRSSGLGSFLAATGRIACARVTLPATA